MVNGYRKIFWGILIANVHINLELIQVLPAFLGWLVIFNGLTSITLEHSNDAFKKAKLISILLSGFTFITFIISFMQIEHMIFKYTFMVTEVLMLLFAYYLFAGSYESFRNKRNLDIAAYINKIQRFYVTVFIINLFIMCTGYLLEIQGLVMIYLVIHFNLIIWLMYITHILKREYNQ